MWIAPRWRRSSKLGMTPVEVSLPDWPYDSLNLILFAEAAAAFEELTLSRRSRRAESAGSRRVAQHVSARHASFPPSTSCKPTASAAKSPKRWRASFREVDLLLVPSLRDEMLVITNFTGHPSLTLRAGFVEVAEARSDWAPRSGASAAQFNPPRRVPRGYAHRTALRRRCAGVGRHAFGACLPCRRRTSAGLLRPQVLCIAGIYNGSSISGRSIRVEGSSICDCRLFGTGRDLCERQT